MSQKQDWRGLFKPEKSMGSLKFFEPETIDGKIVVSPLVEAIDGKIVLLHK